MLFDVIASGSKGNATIVKCNKTVIVIDKGITFKRLEEGLKEINLTFDNITAAFFTHGHTDHIRGLRFIPIKKQYALEGTLPSNNYNVLELFESIMINDVKVTAIPTSHDSGNSAGFVLEHNGEKLVYMTDTGVFLDDSFPYVNNPTYLILESNHDIQMLLKTNRTMDCKTRIMSDLGHLCNEDSALAAKDIVGNNTEEIILAHISEEANTPEMALKAYREVFDYYGLNLDDYNVRVANQHHSTIGGHDED